jgi:hypothetical protein
MKKKMVFLIWVILTLSAQPLCAQESQKVQPAQTEQKAPEKKSWWTSTRKKIVFGLSAIGAAAVIALGGVGYERERARRLKLSESLNAKILLMTPQEVEEMLKQGANPNWHKNMTAPGHAKGPTALHEAAHYNKIENARILLKYGADQTIHIAHGATPLSFAVYFNHPEMVRLLLDSGSDPNKSFLRSQPSTLIGYAKRHRVTELEPQTDPSIIKMLEDAGAKEE